MNVGNETTFDDMHIMEQNIVTCTLALFLIMGLFGNSFILMLIRNFRPCHRYKPGRLLLIWMFGTDLALTVLMILPAFLTSIGWTGMLSGSVLCDIFGFTETILAAHENLIILLMSMERVFIIYFPLREILKIGRTNMLCVFCFLMSVLLATTNYLINSFEFNPDALRCLANFYPEQRAVQLFLAASTMIYVLIPVLTTIVVYMLIIKIVYRTNQMQPGTNRGYNWQAIKTTLMVVGVYLLAVLPFIFSRLYTAGAEKLMPVRFRIFCTVIYMLNTAINPYVCLLTNRSLRVHSTNILLRKRTRNPTFNTAINQSEKDLYQLSKMENFQVRNDITQKFQLKIKTMVALNGSIQHHPHIGVMLSNVAEVEDESVSAEHSGNEEQYDVICTPFEL